jgi:hypothetical protein
MKRTKSKISAIVALIAGFMTTPLALAGTNGQQVYFHGPRGTTEVKITGWNNNDINVTWTGQADSEGNAFTNDWWFHDAVIIDYIVRGEKRRTSCNIPRFSFSNRQDCSGS